MIPDAVRAKLGLEAHKEAGRRGGGVSHRTEKARGRKSFALLEELKPTFSRVAECSAG